VENVKWTMENQKMMELMQAESIVGKIYFNRIKMPQTLFQLYDLQPVLGSVRGILRSYGKND
jgi:hypothetical protein